MFPMWSSWTADHALADFFGLLHPAGDSGNLKVEVPAVRNSPLTLYPPHCTVIFDICNMHLIPLIYARLIKRGGILLLS